MLEGSVQLFISYSHKDENLRRELNNHLTPLMRDGVIKAWHDREIKAGMDWAKQIDDNLNRADIILLLISSDFVASEYCTDIEMKQALQRHQDGEAIIVPVILRKCRWEGLPFSKFQAFPEGAKAVTTWGDKDEAFTNVADGIRKVAQELFEQRQKK